jgi:hypothetical protein
MTTTSHSTLLAALLLAVPATGALAQSGHPADTSGSSRVAVTGGANHHIALGTNTRESGIARGITPLAEDPNVPGATGRIIVPGSHSTIAGDRKATENQRTTSGAG